jgi:hypothetical protein
MKKFVLLFLACVACNSGEYSASSGSNPNSGKCAAPKGTYQYTIATKSGNCGNMEIKPLMKVFDGSESALEVAQRGEICSSSSSTKNQNTRNITSDLCGGSVSSTCQGYKTDHTDLIDHNGYYKISPPPNFESYVTDYSVVSVTSNQSGTEFSGNVTLTELHGSLNTCNGVYSWTATRIGN